jgi:hypothetical protein
LKGKDEKVKISRPIGLACAALVCSGCVSAAEKTGRFLDGTAFAEKTIARYQAGDLEIRETRNRAGSRSVVIAAKPYPMMRLRCSPPDAGGEFYFISMEYLGSGLSGWNAFTLDLSGGGTLSLGEHEAVLSVSAFPEDVQISGGKIRRYDTRLAGDEALPGLRNRRERIAALAGWMRLREKAGGGQSRGDFEKYWKPVLFPETVSRRKRPAAWRREGDEWNRAEDIRWNSGYTERTFPPELRAVRDSGTLLRDWEEALPWVYLEYERENIAAMLSREIRARRKK